MPTKKLSPILLLLSLVGYTLVLSSCETVKIKNRNPCYVNGRISLGATCSTTVGQSKITYLSVEDTLNMLESRPGTSTIPAHAPAVFQTADDYGEETTELEVACRILGNDCTYELQTTITNRKQVLEKLQTF